MIKSVENKKGLKKTSLGWIPEDWKILRLSDIGHTYTGLSGKNKDDFGTGLPYIPYLNIFNNTIIKDGEFDFVRIDINENQSKVEKGDIFFTTSSETPNEVGMCSAFCGETKDLYLNSFCFGFRISVHNKVSPTYLAHYFRSQIGRKIIYRLAQGATRYNLSKTSLLNQSFYIPTYPEQISIANILNRWDLCIDKIKENIKLNEKRKKALMQQLLTGKKRLKGFKDKWKNKNLGDILIPTLRPLNKPDDNYVALGIRSHGKGTFLKNDFDPEDIDIDTLYEVKENDLIVNITFAWEGAIAIAKKEDDGALVSHRFPTYTFNKENGIVDFFRYIIIQPRFKYLLDTISPGGAGRNRVLSKKDFLKLEVYVPSVDEQLAIANILLTTDKEIELLKRKLELLKKQKQGLMQVLLTGKVRVLNG